MERPIFLSRKAAICLSGRCHERWQGFRKEFRSSYPACNREDVDGRDKPGRDNVENSDELSRNSFRSFGTAPAAPSQRPPQVWKFVGTSLWGLVVFAAMFAGQLSVLVYFLMIDRAPFNFDYVRELAGGGLTIALSVVMGLPAALLALWIAIRLSRVPFVDYLALRWTSWWYLLFGIAGMVVLVMGWEGVSYAMGRESSAGFMVDVLKSARAEGALWLLVISFCVVAPITEEFLTRGFLYRGWSESFLRPAGAIVLSSLVWTAMHLQYDWFFFGEIFSIGTAIRLPALPHRLDLADRDPARSQQSRGDITDALACEPNVAANIEPMDEPSVFSSSQSVRLSTASRSSAPCKMKIAACSSMTFARFARLMSIPISSRSTATVESRSSHSPMARSVSFAKLRAKARVDCARGPSLPPC